MAQDARIALGVSSIKLGDIAPDGDMGTILTNYPEIVEGSASFIQAAGTKTSFKVETQIQDFFAFNNPGDVIVKFSLYNVSPESLVVFFGGRVTTTGVAPDPVLKTYHGNNTAYNKEQSCQIQTTEGPLMNIIRLQIAAILTWNLSKTKLAQVDITGTILSPTKVGLDPFSFVYTE